MHIVATILLFLSFFSPSLCRAVVCPPQESVLPCSCKHVAYGLHVVCANLNSSTTLQTAFSVFHDYQIDNLLLHGLIFPKPVPPDLFSGIKVNVLRLENSRLNFNGPAFNGLESSLIQLNVARCAHTKMAKGSGAFRLANLNKLDELNVQYNQIDEIKNSWLKDTVPNLRILALDHNEIVALGDTAFSSLTRLEKISVADNRIVSVSRDMFPRPATALSRIDLSHNVLRTLPTDIFKDMPNIATVVLSGNELQSLPEQTWADIWSNLNTVLLYENSIVCDDRIEWIRERKTPMLLEGTCAAPDTMLGKSLKDVLVM